LPRIGTPAALLLNFMKIHLLPVSVGIACALIAGCSKAPDPIVDEGPQQPATEVAPDAPAPAPAEPATPQPVVVATPAPKRFAPEGVYFTLVAKSVETSDGIFGIKPGTKVVKQADGSFLADGHKFRLAPGEVTNDLDVAARVAGADAQAQAALRQSLQAQAARAADVADEKPDERAGGGSVGSANSSAAQSAPKVSAAPKFESKSALGSGGGLGSGAHSMTKDGWLWQKDESGNWRRVRPLR
jgi:hypothetical protein